MTPYPPAEDSVLLAKAITSFIGSLKAPPLHVLDMGSGTGVQANILHSCGCKDVLCVDIDQEAVEILKFHTYNAIQSDLFQNIPKNSKFNLITFNPPYLPESKHDNSPDTTSSPNGNEIILEFLQQAQSHLKKNANILLLFSSKSNPTTILEKAKELGYSLNLVATKSLFFECLYVYRLSRP